MTDATNVAPGVTDVPVNPDFVHTPAPTESYVPPVEQPEQPPEPEAAEKPQADAGKGKEEKRVSIDEALQKALDKAQKKIEAKNAPEKEEQPKAKADDQPKEGVKAQERGQDGKFQPREKPQDTTQQAVDGQQQVAQPQKQSTYSEPPQRFHDRAKAEWANAPESVRAEIHRAISELESGLKKYKADAEEYEQIREYREMARQYGTTVKNALDNYVGIEKLLHQNLLAGLERIVQNVATVKGLRKADGSPVTLFDVAHSIVNQNPDQRAAQQNSTIAALQAEVMQLKAQLAQTAHVVEEQRVAPVVQTIQKFAEDHPRYYELQDQVAAVLNSGLIPANLPVEQKLKRAYETAHFNVYGELPGAQTAAPPQAQNPGAQTATPAPQPSKLAASKSVTGSPSAVTTSTARKGKPPSIDEALERALRRAS